MFKSLLEDARSVFLEVTNYCNFRCSFCPQAISTRPPQHMETQLARNLIRQLYETRFSGNLYFHLLGEPFLHPDLFEIVESASRLIPKSILFTNGSLLSQDNIESVFAACPYELMISMQLADEQSFGLRGSSMSWSQYASGIRDAVHYKLTHKTSTLLRVSVGVRQEGSIYPQDDYFPLISPSNLRARIFELFSAVPSLDPQHIQELLSTAEFPFQGRLELAPGLSISIKPMGNWRRIYGDQEVETGYCPHVGKELGVLSNGNIVLCHLDYDGKTTLANAKDGELELVLHSAEIEQDIAKFCEDGIVPRGCRYCNVPRKFSEGLKN